MKPVPSLEDLRDWLYHQPQDYKMWRDNCVRCPLAEFLTDYYGCSVRVDEHEFCLNPSSGLSCCELPSWAQDFVERVDSFCSKYVTVRECLLILNRCLP